MSDEAKFVMERVFDAPIENVWKAWTDPKYLAEWYGPGVDTIIHAFDLSPGGVWLNEMKGEAYSMRSKIIFQDVTPPSRLVWHNSMTDADWNIISNPNMPDWPTTMQMCVEFESKGDQTVMTLTWTPFQASDAERACFAGAVENLGKGWGAGMEMLAQVLADMGA